MIGDAGHNVYPEIAGAIHDWEDRFAQADFVTKGSNPWTEHFSAVQAEVPDPEDPSTQVNTRLITTLEEAESHFPSGDQRGRVEDFEPRVKGKGLPDRSTSQIWLT